MQSGGRSSVFLSVVYFQSRSFLSFCLLSFLKYVRKIAMLIADVLSRVYFLFLISLIFVPPVVCLLPYLLKTARLLLLKFRTHCREHEVRTAFLYAVYMQSVCRLILADAPAAVYCLTWFMFLNAGRFFFTGRKLDCDIRLYVAFSAFTTSML